MNQLSGIIICFSFIISLQYASSSWDYAENGPSTWKHASPYCGAQSQSPINIPNNHHHSSCNYPTLSFNHLIESDYMISNNGHSLEATPENPTTIARFENLFYNTYNSDVHKDYCFGGLHFHWDLNSNSLGSEHSINNHFYPLEMHLVHYACEYGDISDALIAYENNKNNLDLDDNNVLSVISVLFRIGDSNDALDAILGDVSNIILPHTESSIKPKLDLNDLLPTNRELYGYKGSLTTPGCHETVRWQIMKHHLSVSSQQMSLFRLLQRADTTSYNPLYISPNYRPIQNLYGRKIYYCNEDIAMEKVKEDTYGNGDDSSEDAAISRRLLHRLQQ